MSMIHANSKNNGPKVLCGMRKIGMMGMVGASHWNDVFTHPELAKEVECSRCRALVANIAAKANAKRLSPAQALEKLKALAASGDTEAAHGEADDILLAVISDPEITEAYEAIEKWYA